MRKEEKGKEGEKERKGIRYRGVWGVGQGVKEREGVRVVAGGGGWGYPPPSPGKAQGTARVTRG